MTSLPGTRKRPATTLRAAALFAFVAVPGLALSFFSGGWLVIAVAAREFRTAPIIVASIGGFVLGGLAMLAGTGRWKRWRYLVLLAAMPLVFLASTIVMVMLGASSGAPLLGGIVAIVVTIWIAREVDRHYRDRCGVDD